MARIETVATGAYGRWQLYIDLVSQSVAANTSYLHVRGIIYNDGTTTSFNNGSVSKSISGTSSWSGSGPFSVAAGAWVAFIDQYFTVAHDGNGNKTVNYTANLGDTGTTAIGGPTSVSASWVLPQITQAPAAPSAVTATRVSDTSQTVGWTINATTAAPYTSQNVQRSTDGGAYATIASGLAGSATSYSDATTSADHSYAYKVVATNAEGSATSTASATIYTTPAAPGTPSASRSGANIVLSFTNAARYDAGVKVYHSADGGAFTLLATVATASTTTYTHASASTSQTHAYKVSTYVGSLESAQSAASATIVAAPAAPTGVTIARTSDTQLVISWTRNATTAAPYTSQNVQRWDNVTNAWATIITGLSGTATTYTNTTTVANRQYKYRVQAVNVTATTTSADSAALQTTPAAPTGAAAVKSGSNIVLTWTRNVSAGMTVTYEIYASQSGGAYALLATVGDVGTYPHPSPSTAVTWTYQVRAKSVIGVTLTSTWATSNTVTLAAPPNAPTSLAPSGVALDAVNAIPLTWKHNPVDSSPQTKFQIEHRLSGSPTWTTVTAVTSATSSWTLPASTYANGAAFEWHVRTWGIATTGGSDGTGASVYSATASVTTSAIPTATISSPGASVVTSVLALAWTYYDAEGTTQAEWQAELLDGSGATVESKAGVNANASYTFIKPVADATSYTVRVRVRDGSGLWSAWDELAFTVAYLPPANVTLTGSYSDGLGVIVITLAADAVVPGVTVDPVSVDIQRSIDGGAWLTIVSALDPNAVFVDTTCATVGLNEYRPIVTSALPSSVTGLTLAVSTNDGYWGYLSCGAGFGTIVRAFANPAISGSHGRSVTIYEDFENRPDPAAAWAANRLSTHTIGLTLTSTSSSLEDFAGIARDAETVLWRGPDGLRVFGALSPLSYVRPNTTRGHVNIGFTVTRTDYDG